MRMPGIASPQSFERALGLILVFNIVDAILTALWVSSGIATEGNPVMEAAIQHGYGPFVLGKVALVGLGVGLLYRHRHERFARVALVPAALLYSFVMGNHFGIGVMVSGIV